MRLPPVPALALALGLLGSVSASAQQPATATRDDGKKVLLYPDGTWRLLVEPAESTPAAPSTNAQLAPASAASAPVASGTVLSKPASATLYVPAAKGPFGVWIDPAKWKEDNRNDSSDPIKIVFTHVKGDGYAMIISERIAVPMDSVKNLALDNAKKVAPDIHVTLDEKRVVNGKQMECMRMEGTTQGVAFIYYGYYYGGPEGTLQVVTYTGANLFSEFQADFDDFLNGTVIGQ